MATRQGPPRPMPPSPERRGRPRLDPDYESESLTVSLPRPTYDRVATEAIRRDVSVACVVRELVLREFTTEKSTTPAT